MKRIAFVEADKYILAEDYIDYCSFKPTETILTSYGSFFKTGEYKVLRGFLFSANSPAINTFNTRRAACIHDFFYSLMKDGHLSRDYREKVDYLFYEMLKEDGMPSFRAFYWWKAVRLGGESALNSPRPKLQYSPEVQELEKTDAQKLLGG